MSRRSSEVWRFDGDNILICFSLFSCEPSGIVVEGDKEANSECRVDNSIKTGLEISHSPRKKEVGVQVYTEHWMEEFWATARRLRDLEILCDVTLTVGTSQADVKTFRAHKLVLVCSSEYFYSCLRENNLEKTYHFETISEAGMEGILKFIYGESGKFTQNFHQDIYHAACVLSIPAAKVYFQSILQQSNEVSDNSNRDNTVDGLSNRGPHTMLMTLDTDTQNIGFEGENHVEHSRSKVRCTDDHTQLEIGIVTEHTKNHPRTGSNRIDMGYKTKRGRMTRTPIRSDTVLENKSRTKKILLPTCNVCGRKFIKRSFLRRHKERQHLRNRERRIFRCDACPKICRTLKDIKLHKRQHTG